MVQKTTPKIAKSLATLSSAIITIFPFLVFITYFMISLETYTYVGALHRYIFFDSYQLLRSTIILGLLLIVTQSRNAIKSSYIDLTLKFNILLLIPVLLGYYTLIAAETLHYPNYVFSTYHIQPDTYINFLYLNSFCILLYLYVYKYQIPIDIKSETQRLLRFIKLHGFRITKFPRMQNWRAVVTLGLIVLCLKYGIDNFTLSLRRLTKETSFILSHPHLSDDQKYRYGWTFVYDYLEFIKAHTPEDALIAFPPAQNHWLTTGNTVVVRYFLYPRKIVNIKETRNVETLFEMPPVYDYVAIAKGEWDDPNKTPYGWPKQSFTAEYLWYYSPETKEVTSQMNTFFDPTKDNNDLKWGLAKVKKESK